MQLSDVDSFGQPGVLNITLNVAGAKIPILGSRLILNLREAYYRPFEEEFKMTQPPPSVKFASSNGTYYDDNQIEMPAVKPVQVKMHFSRETMSVQTASDATRTTYTRD